MIEAASCSIPFGGDPCQYVSDLWDTLWSPIADNWPIWVTWGTFAVVLIASLVIGVALRIFLPGDWAKWPLVLLGLNVLMFLAWAVGSQMMHTKMKAKLDAERARRRAQPPPPPRDRGDDWFKWRW